MALHLIVETVLAAPILVCADTDTVFWAAGFRIPATSAQHDYSTKSEVITVDKVLVMASAHLLPGDTVWHGTDSKAWTCTWSHLRTGHLTLRDSFRKPDVGVIMNTHQQVCALELEGLSWESHWQPAEHNLKLQDTTTRFALTSRCKRAVDALAGIGANKHRNTDLDFFQTHARPS
jgi:hypothetical protein